MKLHEDYQNAAKKRQARAVIWTLNQWVYNHLYCSGAHKKPVSPRWLMEQVPQIQKRFPGVTEELVVAVYPFLTGGFHDGQVSDECFNMVHPFLYSSQFLAEGE